MTFGRTARGLVPALALLVVGGCSLDRYEVSVDRPIDLSSIELSTGATSYGEVLGGLGPPKEIVPTARGFLFRYESFEVGEWKISARYRQGKLAFSTGSGRFGALVVEFDQAGLLTGWSRTEGPLDLGWGGIVGHSLSPELFFATSDYSPVSRHHRWGAALDEEEGSSGEEAGPIGPTAPGASTRSRLFGPEGD